MKIKAFYLICLCGLSLLFTGCAVPRVLWPQKDLQASQGFWSHGSEVVLIASRDSEFKQALVKELTRKLAAASVTHRITGVNNLQKVDTADFGAVVIVSSCIAWGLDGDVSDFVSQQKNTANVILVITSGEGGWLPDSQKFNVDAVSSASNITDIDSVVSDVMNRINAILL